MMCVGDQVVLVLSPQQDALPMIKVAACVARSTGSILTIVVELPSQMAMHWVAMYGGFIDGVGNYRDVVFADIARELATVVVPWRAVEVHSVPRELPGLVRERNTRLVLWPLTRTWWVSRLADSLRLASVSRSSNAPVAAVPIGSAARRGHSEDDGRDPLRGWRHSRNSKIQSRP